jgi:virulence-associated protein VapD
MKEPIVTRKEIAFDLDTKMLEKYYDNISNAYYDLRVELKKAGFEHRQGSVYNSILPIRKDKIASKIDEICSRLPWLADCTKKIDVTNIGETHDLLDKVQKSCDKYDDLKQTWLQNKKRKRSR